MASPVSSALLTRLRNYDRPSKVPEEVCDFCRKPIPENHRHLLDTQTRQLKCTCEVCTITQAIHGSYRIIPQNYRRLLEFQMTSEIWSDFLIPVDMAFFVFNSNVNGIVAYYPAPAGATESKLKMEAWKKVQQLNPVVNSMLPDVEALLVNRTEDHEDYFIVPIDCCYRLIGILKSNWRGISGGRKVHDAINKFFVELKNKLPHA